MLVNVMSDFDKVWTLACAALVIAVIAAILAVARLAWLLM